jgi:hypothetical protein
MADEPEADISLILYAVQICLGYWLNKTSTPAMRKKLEQQIERDWPEIRNARLEEKRYQ